MPEEHEPTGRKRLRVARLAAYGTPQRLIAEKIGVSLPTLRQHYRVELDEGLAEVSGSIAGLLARTAMGFGPRGAAVDPRTSLDAQKFWLARQAKWTEDAPKPKPQFDYARLDPDKRRQLLALLEECEIPGDVASVESPADGPPPSGTDEPR